MEPENDINTCAADSQRPEEKSRLLTRRTFLGATGAGLALSAIDPLATLNRADAAAIPHMLRYLWRATGMTSPDPSGFDAIFETFMKKYGVNAASFAVAKSGVLKYSRGYTWAPSAYMTTKPTSLFRLASVSKAFTCAAIYSLYQNNLVKKTDQVFPLLAITQPALASQTASPFINSITVQNLVDHAGGWNDHGTVTSTDGHTVVPGTNWDPIFSMRSIAQALHLNRPPNKWDIAGYMYGEPLQFKPGTQNFDTTKGASYSNLGYMLLGMVVETVTGQSYASYVRDLMQHIGINDIYMGRTLLSRRRAGEVTYNQPGTGYTPLYPNNNVSAPLPYGGEGWLTEAMDSGGGMITSAPSLTKLAHNYAVWGIGPRPSIGSGGWWGRSGSMAGTSSFVVSRDNNVDFAFILNTRSFPGAPSNDDPPSDLFNSLYAYIDSHPVS